MRRIISIVTLAIVALGVGAWAHASATLKISNDSAQNIINLLVSADREIFYRLDLAPQSSAEVENPVVTGNARVDTGLELWFFEQIPFGECKAVKFESHEAPVAILEKDFGTSITMQGKMQSLVPPDDSAALCELTNFRPNMPMSDVCHILPDNTPVDDNGSYLAGIGFANLPWAGRLAPGTGPQHYLEHMELRRPFSEADVQTVLNHLREMGYAPWQLDFPRAELDFADMPDNNPADHLKELDEVLSKYLNQCARKGARCPAGSLMFAPAGSLDTLANADDPRVDAQLFTLTLKPAAGELLLDVAAYPAEGK